MSSLCPEQPSKERLSLQSVFAADTFSFLGTMSFHAHSLYSLIDERSAMLCWSIVVTKPVAKCL